MRWAGYVARIEDGRRVHTGFRLGDLKEVNHLEDLSVDGRIIWNVSSRYDIGWHWLVCSGLG